jgi:geranylgeranyl diphosphate synthase, type I
MSGMPNELKTLRAEIDTQLEAYMLELPAKLGFVISSDGEQAMRLLQEFALRPGKRIRGALAMVAYKMFGGTKRQTALDLAVAVELAQDYLLIVDDVMDRSQTRRGRATMHRQYRDALKQDQALSDIEHFSDMLAINVGLIAGHLSTRILSEINDNPRRLVQAQQFFQTNIAATGFGQMDDLINQAKGHFAIADIQRMYVLKSGYYTFVNPLQIGAVMAGAEKPDSEALQSFGEYAGLAFQLQDDLLGMFGDEEVTGKSSMDDLREGKMTVLMRHALDHAEPDEAQQLRKALGDKGVARPQYERVCKILIDVGSRDYVVQEMAKATQSALKVLTSQVSWNEWGVECLSGLLTYATSITE